MVSFKVTKKGDLRKALAQIEKSLPDKHVVAGFLGKDAGSRPGKLTNTQLAIIHEFGAPAANIPPRPFVVPSFEKHKKEYQSMLERVAKKVLSQTLKGGTVSAAESLYKYGLDTIGALMADNIKLFVTDGPEIPPPNSPATLARKLSLTNPNRTDNPRTLVDTGRMVPSATYEVRNG